MCTQKWRTLFLDTACYVFFIYVVFSPFVFTVLNLRLTALSRRSASEPEVWLPAALLAITTLRAALPPLLFSLHRVTSRFSLRRAPSWVGAIIFSSQSVSYLSGFLASAHGKEPWPGRFFPRWLDCVTLPFSTGVLLLVFLFMSVNAGVARPAALLAVRPLGPPFCAATALAEFQPRLHALFPNGHPSYRAFVNSLVSPRRALQGLQDLVFAMSGDLFLATTVAHATALFLHVMYPLLLLGTLRVGSACWVWVVRAVTGGFAVLYPASPLFSAWRARFGDGGPVDAATLTGHFFFALLCVEVATASNQNPVGLFVIALRGALGAATEPTTLWASCRAAAAALSDCALTAAGARRKATPLERTAAVLGGADVALSLAFCALVVRGAPRLPASALRDLAMGHVLFSALFVAAVDVPTSPEYVPALQGGPGEPLPLPAALRALEKAAARGGDCAICMASTAKPSQMAPDPPPSDAERMQPWATDKCSVVVTNCCCNAFHGSCLAAAELARTRQWLHAECPLCRMAYVSLLVREELRKKKASNGGGGAASPAAAPVAGGRQRGRRAGSARRR